MSPQLQQVTAWIRGRHPRVQDIDPDQDLIDNRLIDSLGLVEFIILIEKLSGRPLDIDALDIDSFRSLNNIQRRYFA
jgi:acyl carrier protein